MKHLFVFCFLLLTSVTLVDLSNNFSYYMIGGNDAKDGDAPYQVSIQENNYHTCGNFCGSFGGVFFKTYFNKVIAFNFHF